MSQEIRCPICLLKLDSEYYNDEQSLTYCQCSFCGKFHFSGTIESGQMSIKMNTLEPIQRVSVAHKLRNFSQGADSFFLSVEKISRYDERLQSFITINSG